MTGGSSTNSARSEDDAESAPNGAEPTRDDQPDEALSRWCRFLGARTVRELDRLAEESPIMRSAVERLREISRDPEIRRLAEERAAVLGVDPYLPLDDEDEATDETSSDDEPEDDR